MPLTAIGQYEVAVTTPVGKQDAVVCTKTFRYLPITRIALAILILGLALTCRGRPSYWIQTPQRRLVIILLGPFLLMLALDAGTTGFIVQAAFAQLAGLSLFLLYAGSAASGRHPLFMRVTVFLATASLPAALTALVAMGASWWAGLLASLLWLLPVTGSLMAIRKRYSVGRLLGGMGSGYAVTYGLAAIVLIVWAQMFFMIVVMFSVLLMGSLYPIGFLLAMTTNSWCREGVVKALALDRDRPLPPPLP